MSDCLFCRIVAGTIPAKFVYQDEQVVAFEDINPQAPVHVLVIPRRHIASIADFTQAEAGLLVQITQVCAKIARDKGIADSGYRVVTNVGSAAGQSVFHVHLHVLGGRRLSWPPG
jgi:histidine triad (HIT) family protein